jgi:biogenesis AIM24-like protein
MVALKAGRAGDDSPFCRYCRHPVPPESYSCPACGAPVDIRVTDSGWMEQPMIESMTRISCGKTRCQIAGTLTPSAEFDLAPDDWIYFAPHALLWADTATTLAAAPVPPSYDPAARPGHDPRPADLPRRLLEGHGPGHIGVSENHAGELIAVPLAAGQSVHILQHQFLCATGSVSYRYLRSPIHYRKYSSRGEHEYEYPSGRYHYEFTASRRPGLLLLHAAGNVFVRDLTENESILVESGSPVYWEDNVQISMHLEYMRTPAAPNRRDPGSYRTIWLRLGGPGRVAVQSVHKPAEETGTPDYLAFPTVKRW